MAPRGFRFAETMSGTYSTLDEPNDHRRFSFSVEARADSILRHLRDGKTTMSGTLEADGLADCVPIEGTLTLLPLTKKIIRYEFSFTGDDGRPYRFEGQKDIRFTDLRRSFTTLPGEIVDSVGHTVATADTRFDLKADLLQFLASWRLA
jgi:hypothetical protein